MSPTPWKTELARRAAAGALTAAEQQHLLRLATRPRGRWGLLLLLVAALWADQPVAPPDEVFAKINGALVPYATFYTTLLDLHGMEAAQRLVLETALHQEATRLNLLPTSDEVAARLEQVVIEQFGGNAQRFAAWMLESGTDEEGLKRTVTTELVDLKLRTRAVEVTDAKLREFYEANRAKRYNLPEAVRYRQLVVDTKERAAELLQQLQGGQSSFFEAASRHSIDPDAATSGGLVGPLPLPALAEQQPTLHAVLAKLGANELCSAPIEVNGKWFLVLLIERQAGAEVPYDKIAARVRWDYLNANAVAEDEFYTEVLKSAKVTALPARYRALEEQFRKPAAGPTPSGPPGGPVTPNR
ncbi:MAG: peptidyl-prolyl cis-trans isomerase [Fimbriimonadaceae bacterium]|nr:peptidyl-prolyl cis-trans isomerase [Fimbriimonadaceae bacterium]